MEIAYGRGVKPGGNPRALRLIDDVFEVSDATWRGIGVVPASGLKLRGRLQEVSASLARVEKKGGLPNR